MSFAGYRSFKEGEMSVPIGRKTAAISILVMALVGSITAPAYAHEKTIWHGTDRAWVDSAHSHLDVEDNECDGHLVWAEGYYGAYHTLISVYDLNGCNAGWYHVDGYDFTSFRICEEDVSCSAWSST